MRHSCLAAAVGYATLLGVTGLSLSRDSRPAGGSGGAGAPAAIFAQVANTSVWQELRGCILNIAEAARHHSELSKFDLHVALTRTDVALEDEVRRMPAEIPGLSNAFVSVVQNRGADIGEFMQQVQHVHQHSSDFNYDLVVKIHSKSSSGSDETLAWRRRMLKSLCGSPDQVRTILGMFGERPNLGLVGPYKLVWTYDTPKENVFGSLGDYGFRIGDTERKMASTWDVIYPGEHSFPPRDRYLISGGSMFWVRPGPLLSDEFQRAIPKFLSMWDDGYDPNCTTAACDHMFALERVIPTIYYGRYQLDYAQAPKYPYKTMSLPSQLA